MTEELFANQLCILWLKFVKDYTEKNPNYLDMDFNFENFINWLRKNY